MDSDPPQSLEGLADGLSQEAKRAGDQVAFGTILAGFGRRAYGPMLLVPALIALAPTGAIPGMSIVTGSIILLISAQLLVGRKTPWLPKMVLEFEFEADKFARLSQRLTGYASRADRWLRPSMPFLIQPPWTRGIALVSAAMAVLMFPFALLPFAVAAPAATISVVAVGLTANDGRFVAVGLLSALVVLGLVVWFVV